MPFTLYMWLAVVFTYFYASSGLLTAQGCATTSYPFLNVFGMMIGQVGNILHRTLNAFCYHIHIKVQVNLNFMLFELSFS